MRIVGGELGGRSLAGALPAGLRPTSDLVREALFNRVGDSVRGAPFVDLCAGTGAVGLEAWSRGARPVTLVESDRRSLRIIERNLERLGLAGGEERPVLVRADVGRVVERPPLVGTAGGAGWPGTVFLDPPYEERRLRRWLAGLGRSGVLPAGTLLVVEHASRDSVPWPAGDALLPEWSRRYGDTTLSAARRQGG